ncbi:hypothetical protein ACFXGI_08450 [Streptomyces sp. NPDC059355]|uniref:hypothetical protein n=1 Tax=Streptomyces sp. NPDC059355 TaxID=3346811 RepID=UPI0036BAF86F
MNECTEAAHADLLDAIVEALNVPLPSIAKADERLYYRLLARRALAVRIVIATNRVVSRDPQLAADAIRVQAAEDPVTYALFKAEKDGGEW